MKLHDGLGTMLAVNNCPEDVFQIENLWISAYNSENSITLGGTCDAINKAINICSKEGVFHKKLKVTNAFTHHC